MKPLFFINTLILTVCFVSCNEETPQNIEKTITNELSFCDCIELNEHNSEMCQQMFPLPKNLEDSLAFLADFVLCTGVNPYELSDENPLEEKEVEAYINSTSLEIKALPDEELNPISSECIELLEDYAEAIKSYSKLLDKLQKNPDDINLLIARGSEEDNLYSFSSKPLMFQCSSNSNFKKQVEILNGKRDKIISN